MYSLFAYLFALAECFSDNIAKSAIVVAHPVIDYRAEFSKVNEAILAQNMLFGTDVDDFANQSACVFVIAFKLAFNCNGQFADYRSIDKFRLFGMPAALFKFVWLIISRNDSHIVCRGNVFGVRKATVNAFLSSRFLVVAWFALMQIEISFSSLSPPHAAFIAFGVPSAAYVPIISTGSGYIRVLGPKFFLIFNCLLQKCSG